MGFIDVLGLSRVRDPGGSQTHLSSYSTFWSERHALLSHSLNDRRVSEEVPLDLRSVLTECPPCHPVFGLRLYSVYCYRQYTEQPSSRIRPDLRRL